MATSTRDAAASAIQLSFRKTRKIQKIKELLASMDVSVTKILQTFDFIEKAGFEAYLVGGCSRDIFLGRKPKDWDITTNATPPQIQALFVKTVYENKFGTVAVIHETTEDPTLKSIEVTPSNLKPSNWNSSK